MIVVYAGRLVINLYMYDVYRQYGRYRLLLSNRLQIYVFGSHESFAKVMFSSELSQLGPIKRKAEAQFQFTGEDISL